MTKLCECGCGRPAPIAKWNRKAYGHVKGQPIRFIKGHAGHDKQRIEWSDALWEVCDVGYETPCWLWTGNRIDRHGYGRFALGRPSQLAHRVSYELYVGPVPAGYDLDHLCRNPRCINPSHLEPVPHVENIRRGRNAKLTYEIADRIRADHAAGGHTHGSLAELYGVEKRTIWRVLAGRCWVRTP